MVTGILSKIKPDMKVQDPQGKKIGTVREVQFGDENMDQPGPETVTSQGKQTERSSSLIDDIAGALAAGDTIPQEMQSRMLRYGFVRVDTGWFSRDRVVFPDQVSSVDGETVHLEVGDERLAKI